MPLALSHESFLQSPVFQVANEIAVASLPSLTSLLSSASSPSRIRNSIGRWRVVRRAWLQADGLIRIEVAGYPLDRYGNPTLLDFHCRSSLTSRPHGGLGVQTLLGLRRSRAILCRWHLCCRLSHHAHLIVWTRLLRGIRWGSTLVVRGRCIHVVVVVQWRCLWLCWLILTHRHTR